MFFFFAIACTILAYRSTATTATDIPSLNVDVSTDGSYTVSVSGSTWFRSGITGVHTSGFWVTTEDGSLKVAKRSNYSETDVWGPFRGIDLEWRGAVDRTIDYMTSFRIYDNVPAISFVQRYPNGVKEPQDNSSEIVTTFPSVIIEGEAGLFGVTTIHGAMSGSTTTMDWASARSLPGVGGERGPVTVFDREMQNAVVMAPASQFMAASSMVWEGGRKQNRYLGFGLYGRMKEIPKGFEYETVFYAGRGVNDAYNGWGQLMRKRYGKTDDLRKSDFSINYLGYWTDNGACYHYYKGEVNYEQTMLQVHQAAKEKEIPFRYLQLDSWWYFKGPHDGVKNWTAMPDVFPHGLSYVHNQTNWPLVAHNRWWSAETDYAKQNGGQFDFIVEKKMALPSSQDFWDYLIGSAKRNWGLLVYEQDWLYTTFNDLYALQENVTLGRTWLMEMGEAAQRYGVTIQYCMPYPRHLLQSFEIPAVTQSRFSDDYHAGSNQWEIGYQAIFAEALGIAPFKDTFYTYLFQPACADKGVELYPRLEAFSAVYSTGPVGPGDRFNLTDKEIVMETCAKDGRILKPTKPMRAIDRMFTQAAFGSDGPRRGNVWTTHTTIGDMQWHHVFSAEISKFDFYPRDLLDVAANESRSWVSYDHHDVDSPPKSFDESHPIELPECGKSDFGLYHVAPVLSNGWILMGEMAKFVPISSDRIRSVGETSSSVRVELLGSAGENVTISFWTPPVSESAGGALFSATCSVLTNGVITMVVPDGTCL